MPVMHSASALPPIEAFHVGTFTDMHGRKFSYTHEDLRAMCAAYDPAVFAAPLVIGHPTTEAPALGCLGKLAMQGDRVVAADHDQVNPEFAGLVKDGAYKKVSLSLFKPDAPDNPKPGVWYPRHLGFLGAQQPALTGLKAVNFAGGQDGYVTFSAEYDDMTVASLFRTIKNFLLVKFGATDKQAVEDAVPEYLITSLQLNASQELAESGVTSPMFSASGGSPATDPPTTKAGDPMSEELKAAQAAAAAAETRAKEAEAKLAAQAQSARSAEFAAKADALVKEHKLHPDEVEGFVAFMARPDAQHTVEFAAADGTAKSFNARDWMDKFIARRGALVPVGEAAAGKAAGATTAASFAAPADVPVDSSRLDLHNRAVAYAAQHKCDYVTAVKAVEQA